jgi:hypothetical protein
MPFPDNVRLVGALAVRLLLVAKPAFLVGFRMTFSSPGVLLIAHSTQTSRANIALADLVNVPAPSGRSHGKREVDDTMYET